jgi:hypothetical protein
VIRNFGPSDAVSVVADFVQDNDSVGRILSVSPRRFCRVENFMGISGVVCNIPNMVGGRSQRIQVITDEASGGEARVESEVFDSDLSNNRAVVSSSCRGEILSRSAPPSVRYEPTATEPATQQLRLALINTADDHSVEIRRIRLRNVLTDPTFGTPVQITSITPPVPATIPPRGSQLFRVDTLLPAGAPARDAGRPYFLFRARCAG